LLDKLEAELPVDRSLIAVGGISNGAMMAYRFGAERAERVAAIASVSGTIGGQAEGQAAYVIPMPKVPVAVVAFHGTNDRYGLGRLTKHGGCRTGSDVWLYTIEGGEHSWPGGHLQQPSLEGTLDALGLEINTEISASELMWSFFAAHRRTPISTPIRPEG
jgi:polyhydroxybutyrate depolymerase